MKQNYKKCTDNSITNDNRTFFVDAWSNLNISELLVYLTQLEHHGTFWRSPTAQMGLVVWWFQRIFHRNGPCIQRHMSRHYCLVHIPNWLLLAIRFGKCGSNMLTISIQYYTCNDQGLSNLECLHRDCNCDGNIVLQTFYWTFVRQFCRLPAIVNRLFSQIVLKMFWSHEAFPEHYLTL